MKLKRPISVRQMAKNAKFSPQRFYDLIKKGVFPEPLRSGSRPMYSPELQEIVLAVLESGIGANGDMVLFNQKSKKEVEVANSKPASKVQPLIESLASLGLSVTAKQVGVAINELSITDIDSPESIRQVFLHLKS